MTLMTWIVPSEIAVSRLPTRRDTLRTLSRLGIGAIVCLATEHELSIFWGSEGLYESAVLAEGMEILFMPVEKGLAPDPRDMLAACRWIDGRARSGKPVAIHCFAGVGRSGTLAAAYLVYSNGLNAQAAIDRVRRLRPGAVETHEQEEAVRTFSAFMMMVGMGEIPLSIALSPPDVRPPGILRRASLRLRTTLKKAARALRLGGRGY